MNPTRHAKQSWEIHILTFDASNSIASGDTISSVTVKAYDSDGDDVSSTIISGTPSSSGTDISATVQAGTDGEDYNIRVRITTANAEQIEDDLVLRIRDES